ncbi:MAG: hypothetical protein DIU65_08180 [Proteobacteria bacterium]|nr:MAG: hypothetical protein DIU65_08180 [Pseudomonadota bacterium]
MDLTAKKAGNSGKDAPLPGLATILLASLEALAKAGEVDAACRQAGKACAQLRLTDPDLWRRFNAFLHRWSRHTHLNLRGEENDMAGRDD